MLLKFGKEGNVDSKLSPSPPKKVTLNKNQAKVVDCAIQSLDFLYAKVFDYCFNRSTLNTLNSYSQQIYSTLLGVNVFGGRWTS